MKRLLLAAALVVALPLAARADDCVSLCQTGIGECKKDCAGDAECLKQCDTDAKMCPKMCAAMSKSGGDQKKLQHEMEKIFAEQEAAEAKQQQQQDEAQERQRARNPKHSDAKATK